MTRWQIFLETALVCMLPIISVLLVVCILGFIWELARREHEKGD